VERRKRLFISYGHQDADIAGALHTALSYKHDVWLDTVLMAGHKWWPQIEQAIQDCDLFIILVPRSYFYIHSTVLRECRTAKRLGKSVIPICINKFTYEALKNYNLTKIQAVILRVETTLFPKRRIIIPDDIGKLIDAIQIRLSQEPPLPGE
jgi:hypothetical protein